MQYVMLTEGTPVLSSTIELKPRERMRLMTNTHQAIHRIKNCCGKVNDPYAFQLYYLIRNLDTQNVRVIHKGTFLTDIISDPNISTHLRMTGKEKKCVYHGQHCLDLHPKPKMPHFSEDNEPEEEEEEDITVKITTEGDTVEEKREEGELGENDDDDDDDDDNNDDYDHIEHDNQNKCCCADSLDKNYGQWMYITSCMCNTTLL